jgi:hypothetical protein
MTFAGATQYAYTTRILPPGRSRWWIATSLKLDQPLPGGAWGCSFAIGRRRLAASFRSGGPTGRVVDLAVCRAVHALRSGAASICPRDESGTPFLATDAIVCNGVLVGQQGKTEAIDLAAQASPVIAGTRVRITTPVFIAFQLFDHGHTGDNSCVFLVDGTQLTERTFTVGG